MASRPLGGYRAAQLADGLAGVHAQRAGGMIAGKGLPCVVRSVVLVSMSRH